MTQRSLIKRIGYNWLKVFCRLVAVTLFRIRCHGRERIPATGAVLVCANHQSYLDPAIVGLAIDRRLNYLARKTLFRHPLFSWLINYLDAIPLDREGLGMAGLKECLRRLKQGEMVLIFPEGTRTYDGSIRSLQPGFVVLARRNHATILPVAIDGAYDAWPRTAIVPNLSTVHVHFGEPITAEMIAELDDSQLVTEVEKRIRECHAAARAGRARSRA